MNKETPKATFERWLSDGKTWIGVFENHDLSSHNPGHRFALSFDDSQFDKAKVNNTRAPDHKAIGLGWRYLLVGKFRDADAALDALENGVRDPIREAVIATGGVP